MIYFAIWSEMQHRFLVSIHITAKKGAQRQLVLVAHQLSPNTDCDNDRIRGSHIGNIDGNKFFAGSGPKPGLDINGALPQHPCRHRHALVL